MKKEELLDIIKKRRSVREYKKKVPAVSDVENILESARWAPSGLNNQPWRFSVIDDVIQKNSLAEFTKYKNIIKGAPMIILVFMDNRASYNRDKDIMAIGACIENMLLTAASLKIGTCWLGEILNRKREVCDYLKADKNLELMAVISLGYAQKTSFAAARRVPLSELKIKI